MRDPNTLATEILDILDRMIDLVSLENTMLASSEVELFEPLVDRKVSLFEQYTKKLEYLRRFKEVREGISEDLREEMLEANEEFQALAESNQRLLEAAVEAGNQMFESFSQAALDSENRLSRYSKMGARDTGGRRSVALAYNQEL